MKIFLRYFFCSSLFTLSIIGFAQKPEMYFGDTTKIGRPYAKDPSVVYFNNQYFLYYSTPGVNFQNWNIGIASSNDLLHWKKVGELNHRHLMKKTDYVHLAHY